ncbi:hypothetical protein ABZ614_07310 [Streptomyces sp. NPDC013178]
MNTAEQLMPATVSNATSVSALCKFFGYPMGSLCHRFGSETAC